MNMIDNPAQDVSFSRYAEVLRLDPQPCVLVNVAGEVLFINPAARALLPGKLLQDSLDRYPQNISRLTQAQKVGTGSETRIKLLARQAKAPKDDQSWPVTLAPLSSPSVIPLILMRLGAACSDTAARRKAQLSKLVKARKHSDKRFRQYLNSSLDGICALDKDGRIALANQSLSRLLGRSNLLGSLLFDHLDLGPVHQDLKMHDRIDSAIASLVGAPHEGYLRQPHGDPTPIEVTITPLKDQGARHFVVVIRDISTRTAFRETLARSQYLEAARDIARANEQTKTQFLATVSHEMRAPLGAIATASDLLLNDADLQPEHRQLLEVIRGSADTALDQINDTLEHVRMDLRPIKDHPVSRFSPREVLEKLAKQSRVGAMAKGLELILDLDCPPAIEVEGYHHLFHRVVQNLLSNAVKYSDQGAITLTTRFDILRQPGNTNAVELVLKVSDTGRGIPAEKVKTLFEPFETGENDFNSLPQSAGLGLSIVKRAVEAMDGEISVCSEVGKGSTFTVALTFTLPGRDAAAETAGSPLPVPVDASGFRFLVVDDNPLNRQLMSKLLQSEGSETYVAENGEQALEMMQELQVDAVLMDIGMPGIDGLETTRRMLRLPGLEQLPVFGLTGFSDPEVRERAEIAGMSHVYVKPLRRNQLHEIVGKVMHGNATEQSNHSIVAVSAEVLKADVARQIARISGDNWSVFVNQLHKECASMLLQMRQAAETGALRDLLTACRRGSTTAASVGAVGLNQVFLEIEELANTEQSNDLIKSLDRSEEILEQTRLALTLL